MRSRPSVVQRTLLVFAILGLAPDFAAAQGVPARIAQVIDETRLTVLPGNTYPLARAAFDRGPAPSNLPMNRMLLLLRRSPEQETVLESLLEQQQDKSSPNYHRWLTPSEFGEQFGPAEQDIQIIISWLASEGFAVNRVSNGRVVIEFSGSAQQVRNAFHAEIHQYDVNGQTHYANSSDPEIPTALTPVVAGIVSLHDFTRKPLYRIAAGDTENNRPLSTLSSNRSLFTAGGGCGLNGTVCYAVGPYDFATIYNILPLWNATPAIDGTGQTIAIVGQSDIYPQDVSNFRSDFGLPAPNLNIIYDGPNPGKLATEGDEMESDLDVEWSGAIAKGATVDFVVSGTTNSTEGVDLSAEYIVDNDLAPVMSESYGDCELDLGTAGNQFYSQLWQQAAAEGITVFVAAGDSGSAVCDQRSTTPATNGLAVNGVASTPYDIAVGGTDFNDLSNPTTYWNSTNNSTTQESAKSYIPEMTWNDTCTNSEFFQFTGSTNAESDCNDTASIYWPAFLAPVGGSGGASNCTAPTGSSPSSCAGGYAKPAWQMGTGVPSDGKRDIPDLSMFAGDGLNASFYVVCETDIYGGCADDVYNLVPVGGTSAPTPSLAGIMAMVNEKTQGRQGNANYVLYPFAAQTGASCNSSGTLTSSCVFYDVTTGTNAMPCVTGSLNCITNASGDQNGVLSGYSATPGYDLATGLGSVNVANLVNEWTSVTFEPTVTTLTLNGGSTVNVAHGTPVNFSVSVTPETGTGTPTGFISLLTSAGPTGGMFALANGSVSTTTGLLPGGSYTVTAHYAGDGTFGSSDSSPAIPVTVNSEPSITTVQAFTLDANGNSVPFVTGPYGSSVVYLRASVAGQSGQGVATGTVNFTETVNGTTANLTGDPYSLNSEGYTMTPLPGAFYTAFLPGSYSIAANYSGDASFNPSSAPAISFTITKAPTNTTITKPICTSGTGSCVITLGSGVTFVASVSSNTPATANLATGTVAFYDNGTELGSGTIDSSEIPLMASFGTNQLPLGINSVTAQYSGDTNFAGSTSPVTSIDAVIGTTVGLAASSTTIESGQSVTFTAQVAPRQSGGPVPTGSVSFTANGTNIGSPVTLSDTGEAQITTNSLPLGSVEIAANYSGDVNYSASSATLTETVNGPTFRMNASPTTITVPNPGQSGSTTVTFSAQGGFTGSAILSGSACSNLPPESSCSFSPATLTFTSSTTTIPVTLTVSTTAASSLVPSVRAPVRKPLLFDEAIAVCLMAIFMILSGIRWRYDWRKLAALVLLGLAAFAIGCSGGSGGNASNSGTPAGNYTGVAVTVTINGVTQSIGNLSVNVQ